MSEEVGVIFSFDSNYPAYGPVLLLYRNRKVGINEFLVDEDGIVYQVKDLYSWRRYLEGEEDLYSDPGKNYRIALPWHRLIALRQLGRFENGEFVEALFHVRPRAVVRRARDEEIRAIIGGEEGIKIGEIPGTGIDVHLDLNTIFRQGLFVIGAIGTGKTTTLLTLIARIVRYLEKRNVKNWRIIVVDKDGEFENLAKIADGPSSQDSQDSGAIEIRGCCEGGTEE